MYFVKMGRYACMAILLPMMIFLFCQCGKDHVVSPGGGSNQDRPPLPDPGQYLVTYISVNNIGKDSMVYNDKKQVARKWEFVPFYRRFMNYVDYTYDAEGYVSTAVYYNYIGGYTVLTRRDTIEWVPGKVNIYSTLYSGQTGAVSGKDTWRYKLDNNYQLTIEGSKDTFPSFNEGRMVHYIASNREKEDIIWHKYVLYVESNHLPDVANSREYTMQYGIELNPLYPMIAGNPLLARAILSDVFPDPMDKTYPWLLSKHYVTGMQYIEDDKPVMTSTVSYTLMNNTRVATKQVFPGIQLELNYRYIKMR
ncbi:MAG: hypothetical protein JO154_04950 [Chitinophaga sp.]|uniref:hypothetical protein n=1 Tax=Chitinophaga sp. TaxID=1869181 RepID=UPI0025C38C8E|nr:hypothetical protein [Chitinophaga sp.]MBV8251937.1 hypothetical protein [Chitinophaga sp.]